MSVSTQRTWDTDGTALETVSCWPYADGRFHIGQRLWVEGTSVNADLRLGREQATWLRDRLTDVLNETDPAYIAHAESESAKAAALDGATPATDNEWKARLADGCKS